MRTNPRDSLADAVSHDGRGGVRGDEGVREDGVTNEQIISEIRRWYASTDPSDLELDEHMERYLADHSQTSDGEPAESERHELARYDDLTCKHCGLGTGYWPTVRICSANVAKHYPVSATAHGAGPADRSKQQGSEK